MEHVQTLIWYDFMLLGQYEHEGEHYLVLWSDLLEGKTDVYHVIHVDDDTLRGYLSGTIPLLDVMQCAPVIYASSTPEDPSTWLIVHFDAIGPDNLPTADSFFDGVML